MGEFDDLRCPFRAEVLASMPVWQMMLVHGAGALALLMLLR